MYKDAKTYFEDYTKNRAENMRMVKRQTWSTTDVDSYADLVKKFDAIEENAEWEVLFNQTKLGKPPPLPVMEQWRTKIAWLGGCKRDIRRQFACEKSDRMRVAADHKRMQTLNLLWVKKILVWFDQKLEAMAKAK